MADDRPLAGQNSTRAAVNALGANHRKHALQLARVETKLDGMNSRVRSIEEDLAEVKDLLVRVLDGR
jgi:hypothetical protein